MQLDWEVSNYGFNSRECKYSWRDIRLIALRSELRQYPGAKVGDLLITFPDNGYGEDILEHFCVHLNFRHGQVDSDRGEGVVNIFLAPLNSLCYSR
jgi:hypothetical protein